MDDFYQVLENASGDVNRKEVALSELEGLKQRNRTFQEHYSEFIKLRQEADYHQEPAHISKLKGGLSRELTMLMIVYPTPTSLKEYVALLQGLDARRRAVEGQHTRNPMSKNEGSRKPFSRNGSTLLPSVTSSPSSPSIPKSTYRQQTMAQLKAMSDTDLVVYQRSLPKLTEVEDAADPTCPFEWLSSIRNRTTLKHIDVEGGLDNGEGHMYQEQEPGNGKA
ncbi:hypothetical protein LTS18_011813 [Coniosporium uncinatum]|uniref:Uncharacterized protein n=1 Tax=Coniosporium uncinatum TaxID=93489 RepID=A0ACC3D9M8_9PEZI|nr:hypothetical protein LTS18_011813 [Coniosporium uncinatum]